MLYLNDLINNSFVDVGKCNFLSKELHVQRAQGLAGRISPPIRKLSGKNTTVNLQL